MFVSKVVPRLGQLCRVTNKLQSHGQILRERLPLGLRVCCSDLNPKLRSYSTAADNRAPPRWVTLEPELDEALVPRKMSVSPLETWLSLHYTLPPLLEAPLPQAAAVEALEEKVLPPFYVPVMEDGEGSATPLSCKNVLKIRRRKMNHHKYKKLVKRTRFLKKRVLEGRGKKKQKLFEKDLTRIWQRAGLKKAPEGWSPPQIFIKRHGRKQS